MFVLSHVTSNYNKHGSQVKQLYPHHATSRSKIYVVLIPNKDTGTYLEHKKKRNNAKCYIPHTIVQNVRMGYATSCFPFLHPQAPDADTFTLLTHVSILHAGTYMLCRPCRRVVSRQLRVPRLFYAGCTSTYSLKQHSTDQLCCR